MNACKHLVRVFLYGVDIAVHNAAKITDYNSAYVEIEEAGEIYVYPWSRIDVIDTLVMGEEDGEEDH